MPAALVVASETRANVPFTISGTGWTPGATVTVSVLEENLKLKTQAAAITGDWDMAGVFEWTPSRSGVLHLIVSDGTTTMNRTVKVYSTT